jgi:multiple sugar transport system substrate-binding protein
MSIPARRAPLRLATYTATKGVKVGFFPQPKGPQAVVFPAIASQVPRAVAKHEKDGVDVSAFTSYVESKHTTLYPITDKAPQINLIVQSTFEKLLLGDGDVQSTLKDMNDQVNNVLEIP